MKAEHKSIQLSARDLEYLKGAGFLPASLVTIVETARFVGDERCVLLVSSEVAEEFRSAFTDRLAKVGFAPDYELTGEGKSLEELIDRFFPK